MKIVKGYVSSSSINNNFIPQKLQNLLIRDFCSNNSLSLNLSSIEYSKSILILKSLLKELRYIDGIVFFSIYQLPKNEKLRLKIYNQTIQNKKTLYFALENKSVTKRNDFQSIEDIFKINNVINENQNSKILERL